MATQMNLEAANCLLTLAGAHATVEDGKVTMHRDSDGHSWDVTEVAGNGNFTDVVMSTMIGLLCRVENGGKWGGDT